MNKYYFQKHIVTSHFVVFMKNVASFSHTLVATLTDAPAQPKIAHWCSAERWEMRCFDAAWISCAGLARRSRATRAACESDGGKNGAAAQQ